MFRNSKQSLILLHRLFCSAKNSNTAEQLSDRIGLKASTIKNLKYETKIPQQPINSYIEENTTPIEIDSKTIQLLERLSLVDLDSKEALKTLQDSIQFADRIVNINTDGIEPLYTVLEDQNLDLRDDEITDGNIKDDILRNATLIEEDYFVAPPGNIPLEQEDKKF